ESSARVAGVLRAFHARGPALAGGPAPGVGCPALAGCEGVDGLAGVDRGRAALVVRDAYGNASRAGAAVAVGDGEGDTVDASVFGSQPLGTQEDAVRRRTRLRIRC